MPRSQRLILIAVCLSLAAVVSAVSSLNVALPDLARATGATATQLQWIVDAYALVFAGLLLPAGALGDRVGRRRVLLTGLAVFGGGAVAAMTLDSPGPLIAVRAVMGIGAALIMPTTLSIITATFSAEARDRAVGVWAGVAGGSALLGLLTSGLLLERFAWSSVFASSALLAGVGAVLTLRYVPAVATEEAPLDGVAALLSALGLGGVVWSFIEGPDKGWTSAPVVAGFGAGALLLTAFVLWELRTRQPLLDPRLFAVRGFRSGALSIFVQFFAMFGIIFVVLQYLQFALRYSPLQAGAGLAPTALVMVGLAPRVPRLAARFGQGPVGALGLALMAVGLILASTLGLGAAYPQMLASLMVVGVGMALAGPPATAVIVASLPADKQGVASAVNDTAREVGGALGIAVLGSVLADHVAHFGPAMDLSQLVDGYQSALRVGAAVLLAGGAVVLASHLRAARKPAVAGSRPHATNAAAS